MVHLNLNRLSDCHFDHCRIKPCVSHYFDRTFKVILLSDAWQCDMQGSESLGSRLVKSEGRAAKIRTWLAVSS